MTSLPGAGIAGTICKRRKKFEKAAAPLGSGGRARWFIEEGTGSPYEDTQDRWYTKRS